jgi:hypothetical protein
MCSAYPCVTTGSVTNHFVTTYTFYTSITLPVTLRVTLPSRSELHFVTLRVTLRHAPSYTPVRSELHFQLRLTVQLYILGRKPLCTLISSFSILHRLFYIPCPVWHSPCDTRTRFLKSWSRFLQTPPVSWREEFLRMHPRKKRSNTSQKKSMTTF